MSDNNEYITSLNSDKEAVLVENNAQTIFDHINELEKNSPIYAKRWFWELLQNAKDSVEEGEKVKIRVELSGNTLRFQHTGNPFKKKDVLHLIFHGSSKKDLLDKTGRFGTGFMTTHLLARRVQLKGMLTDGYYFNFPLNREAAAVLEQKTNLDNSFEAFGQSLTTHNPVQGDYTTEFSYDLGKEGFGIAKEGLTQATQILPFALVFNGKISDIEIVQEGSVDVVHTLSKDSYETDGMKVEESKLLCGNEEKTVLAFKRSNITVTVLIDEREGFRHVVDMTRGYPKLFCDFPLFGTEELGYPAILNSPNFDVLGEREGIYLAATDKADVLRNKELVKDAINALPAILNFLAKRGVRSLYNLSRLNIPKDYKWLDNKWLTDIYRESLPLLLSANCVNVGSNLTSLNSCSLASPALAEAQRFFELNGKFLLALTPSWEDTQEWLAVVKAFALLETKVPADYPFVIDEHKLANRIQESKDLNELEGKLLGEPSEEEFGKSICFLNAFYELLSKDQILSLTEKYKILVNQRNILLTKSLETPTIDNIGDEEIKLIAEAYGWDLRTNLIHHRLKFPSEVFQATTQAAVINKLSDLGGNITEDRLAEQQTRNGLVKFFKWLIDRGKLDKLRDAWVIVEKGRETEGGALEKRRLLPTPGDKLMTPVGCWKDKYALYADVVPKRNVLVDEYYTLLTTENFEYLSGHNLVYKEPLIEKSQPGKNDMKLLTKNEEAYGKLLNEKGDLIEVNVSYSDIPFFTTSEDGILKRSSDSAKVAKQLLKFLLDQVIANDGYFGLPPTIVNEVEVSQCLWVARLSETSWLHTKTKDGGKETSTERPSVANMTALVKGDEELMQMIQRGGRKAIQLFNLMGVSVADLIRNALDDPQAELEWDMTFAQLLTKGINPHLASKMLSDPKLQEIYEAQQRQTTRILENQRIGDLFEKIFQQIFESEEFRVKGLKIKRTGVGSDYEVSLEQDLIDDKGQQVLFEVGNTLIELKAAGKDYAEMTPKQGKKASRHDGKYALAVLPLAALKDEINVDTVKKHVRFITRISDKVRSHYSGLESYLNKKSEVMIEKQGIQLSIEDGKVRFKVKSEVWENESADLDGFLEWLKAEEKSASNA